MNTTWRKLLQDNMKIFGETFEDIAASTLTEEQMDKQFDNSWGGIEGAAFTVWTKNRVYFPVCYDGREWVRSVLRYPDILMV